jgi:pyruvate,orthophosphate dikinase
MLQTRNGKRTGTAALRIALDLEREGLVSKDEAVMMVEPRHLDQLLHPLIADGGKKAEREGRVAGRGLAASPGAAVGTAVFSAEAAEAAAKQGRSVILVRKETSPEDVGGKRERERERKRKTGFGGGEEAKIEKQN